MNLFRLFGLGALLAVAGAGISSCLSPPDFPVIPAIDFKEFKLVRVPNADGGNREIDTVYVSINFQDGDGDLGMSTDEAKLPPYSAPNGAPLPGGPRNLGFSKNFYVQPYKKNANGDFVKLVTPLLTLGRYDGTYPRLDGSVDGKPAPLKGSITYILPSMTLDRISYNVGDELRFEISIMDRAKHESNVITTPSIILGK